MVTGKDKDIYPERTWLMPTETAIHDNRLIDIDGLGALCRVLAADGYHVIGPAFEEEP